MLDLDVLAAALRDAQPPATLVVPLGDTANRFYAAADSPRSFYVLGAMGMSIPLALGLSLAPRRRVIAIEGDGAVLMNLGGLVTAARYGTVDLGIVVLDNGTYASTGGQATSLDTSTSIAALATAAGLPDVRTFQDPGDEESLAAWVSQPGLKLAVAVIDPVRRPAPFVPLAPPDIASRGTY